MMDAQIRKQLHAGVKKLLAEARRTGQPTAAIAIPIVLSDKTSETTSAMAPEARIRRIGSLDGQDAETLTNWLMKEFSGDL